MHRKSLIFLVTALAVGWAMQASATASAQVSAACPMKKSVYSGDNPRVQRGSLEVRGHEYKYTVLLPSDYASSRRSYPVLYWLHGASGNEDYTLVAPTTPHFLENLSADEPVIIVMPDGGFLGMYSDWGEPEHMWETFHIEHLIPHVDSAYRTLSGRKHRAIAGLSMGGLGALSYAGRHPELFTAAASFSGLLDTSSRSPAMKAFLTSAGPVLYPLCSGSNNPLGPWGDPATNGETWEAHNPTALAPRLRNTSVYAATGDGMPCDDQDRQVLATESPTNPLRAIEPLVDEANRTFHRAMTEAGVPMVFDHYGCGLHSWRYWERDFRAWWPMMRAAFGEIPSARPTRPRAKVSIKPRQRVVRQKGLLLNLACDEPCDVKGTAAVHADRKRMATLRFHRDLARNGREALTLRLSARELDRTRRALARGRVVRARIRLTVAGDGGGSTVVERSVDAIR